MMRRFALSSEWRPALRLAGIAAVVAACSLDVPLVGGLGCAIKGQAHPGTANGLTVLIEVPRACPFEVGETLPVPRAFAATIFAASAWVPDNTFLYSVAANRNNVIIKSDVHSWTETVNGLVRAAILTTYQAASGGFDIDVAAPALIGRDYWRLSTTQMDTTTFSATVETGATVYLTYFRHQYAQVSSGVPVANPNEQVSLTAHAPAWLPEPHHYLWYRNGDPLGSGGQTFTVMSGGPNETVNFEVVVTGSDSRQVLGSHALTSRESSCDPYMIICP